MASFPTSNFDIPSPPQRLERHHPGDLPGEF
jgi:hypothetical protein